MIIAAKLAPNENELKKVQGLYEAVELYTNKHLLNNANIAKKFDFIYAVHSPVDFFNASVIDFAHKINAKVIVTHDITDNLPELVDEAASVGITICMEYGGQYKIKTIEAYKQKKKQAPKLKICVDTEHAVMFNMFPKIFKLGKEIQHIHLTGSPPGFHTPPMNNPELVKKAVQQLKKINYSKLIVLEMDLEHQKKEIFQKAKTFMSKLF
jgi:sugar phosphate isomerase/epimerase